jgi:NAD(P)-dependent dehydrogenase (short-subunit alcohol dehydrogenase family)
MACVSVEVSPHWQQLPKSTYKTFGINVKVFLFTVQKALPLFQDGGSIILAASAGASKGLEALSFPPRLSRTVDLKHCKIRVNGISPGPIDDHLRQYLLQDNSFGRKTITGSLARPTQRIWTIITKIYL